jgi:hypothetical protein
MKNKEILEKKFKFTCNAGKTEEIVTIKINPEYQERSQVMVAFHRWLEQNSIYGFEEVKEND